MSNQARTAIVTGSASGLGRALAVRLARDGWRLALADIAEEANRETLALVEQAGGAGHCERLDVSRLEEWLALRERLQSHWKQLDLLVNNAGIAGSGEVGGFPIDEWRRLLDVDLLGVVYGCHVFIDWLKNNPHHAHVINTASLAAYAAAPTMAAYNVAKAGVAALSETLYAEAKQHGVGVTVLCPGFFSTNLLLAGHFDNEDEKRFAQQMMEKSAFDAEHVADLAVQAMTRRRLYVVTGARARWLWRMKRWFPSVYISLLARRYAQGLPSSD